MSEHQLILATGERLSTVATLLTVGASLQVTAAILLLIDGYRRYRRKYK